MEEINKQNNGMYAQNDNDSIDLKNWIIKFLSYWYLFVIFGCAGLAVSYVYNRYTSRVYQTQAYLYIKEQTVGIDPTAMITGMSFRNAGNVDNQIAILQSFLLKERAIKNLDFEVSYYIKGRVAKAELYMDNPFTVEFDDNVYQLVGVEYGVKFLDNSRYVLTADIGKNQKYYNFTADEYVVKIKQPEMKFVDTVFFGDTVDNGYNKFRIVLNGNYNTDEISEVDLSFRINDYLSLIKSMGNITVTPSTKNATVVNVVARGNHPQKITNYLNQLLREFVNRELELKNRVSENTILFIDEQLMGIQDSLSKAEFDLQNFQKGNDFMNLDAQATQLFNHLKALEQQRGEVDLNLKYYMNLKKYVEDNINDVDKLIAPSAMGIQDPLLNKLVSTLVELSAEKSIQLLTSTEKSPAVQSIDEQITQTKTALLENINNMISNAQMTMEEIDVKVNEASVKVKELPNSQRLLLGYERKFAYNDNLYNFLMQNVLKHRSLWQVILLTAK